jgi:hypothetical protein
MKESETLQRELANRDSERAALTALWNSMIPVHTPKTEQLNVWLSKYGFNVVRYGISETGAKYARIRGTMSEEYLMRFASSVMLNRERRTKVAPTEVRP